MQENKFLYRYFVLHSIFLVTPVLNFLLKVSPFRFIAAYLSVSRAFR